MIEAKGPNAEQIHYWNEVSGPKWVRLDKTIGAMISPFGVYAMNAAKLQSGEQVVDVGCGCGETSFALAEAVGATGSVLGVDISNPMLTHATEKRDRMNKLNVKFLNADAQILEFGVATQDLVFSRFGVMFFAEPEVAFANLRSCLKPGGRLVFACWQAREKNPWMAMPAAAAASHFNLPPGPPPGSPGPFSMSDPQRTVERLHGAGYRSVECHSVERKIDVSIGKSIEDTVSFLSQMGPAGSLLKDAPPEKREAALRSMREALLLHQTSNGIELDAAAWVVTATRD